MEKIRINLRDGSFPHQKSATLGGDNSHREPSFFMWDREGFNSHVTFYTDMRLRDVGDTDGLKVAWLLEPPSLHDGHYKTALELQDQFDYILTFHKGYIDQDETGKWLYYPLGGLWVDMDKVKIYEKSKDIVIICSQKTGAEGHCLRHRVVSELADKYGIEVYGRGYSPIQSKLEALKDARFAIIIESTKLDLYFSEKLIDCFATGTIPIYRGSKIHPGFDEFGIIEFDDFDELKVVLKSLTDPKPQYYMTQYARTMNFDWARKYYCVEDWLWNYRPFLFEHDQN